MALADKELEEKLREAGTKLADPPSSVDELLPILDQVEHCLSKVEQSPTQSTQDALSPALKALIADKLFKHSDVDVKVAVASCISEITRITAPEAPYDDDQMKEVFQLIVSSFENLHDMTNRSYAKRTMILETVAKVRSCVVMLDLECDAMILEMFQHFLKTIRDYHHESVFSSMETIMTLVLEESEEIPTELLSPILASVKKDNEEVLPIARKLGERVLESCSKKIKPSLLQAVNNLGNSVDDYSNVVASICQDSSGSLERKDVCATSEHVGDERKSAKEPAEESTKVVIEDEKEESAPPQQDDLLGDKSPKSVMSNGIAQAGEDDVLEDSKSLKKQDESGSSIQSTGVNLQVNEEPNDLDTGKADNSEQKLGHPTRKRGRKSSSSAKLTEPSEGLHLANEKEDEKMTDSKSHRDEVPSSSQEDRCVEAAGPLDNDKEIDKEIDTKISPPKTTDVESDVAPSPSENHLDENLPKKLDKAKKEDTKISPPKTTDVESDVAPSPNENLLDENLPKKLDKAKKEDISAKEVASEDVLKKASEVTSDSEAKPSRRSAKKTSDSSSGVKKPTAVDSVKKGSETTSDPDSKKHSDKTVEKGKGAAGSSSKQSGNKKKQRSKINAEVGVAKSSVKVEKEKVSSPKSATKSQEHLEETPNTDLKRKRTPGKENESNVKLDQSLVGTRVKVWWPVDKMYYTGVIDHYNRSKKKHTVKYDDGDVEILHLPNEDWKIIDDVSAPDEVEGSDHGSTDGSDDVPPKKKGKSSAIESTKEGKKDASSKSGGATSSKSKGAAAKSIIKSKDDSKSDRKSKDQTPKSGGGKSIDAGQKASCKSKNTDGVKTSKSKEEDASAPKPSKSKQETPKTGGKSKQETSKTASASKAKSSKSGGGKSNGTGKMKSNILQAKDSDTDNTEDSTKEMEEDVKVEDVKGKMAVSSKAGSEAKSGKKRGRN